MIENLRDEAATKAARKARLIKSPSWISIAGHVFLGGKDRMFLRERVRRLAKNICYICGKFCADWDGDLEHIEGKRKYARCDCLDQVLVDGTVHTNVAWAHGMRSTHPCHRAKHNREIKWTSKK